MLKQRCKKCGRVIKAEGNTWDGSIEILVEGNANCFHDWKEV